MISIDIAIVIVILKRTQLWQRIALPRGPTPRWLLASIGKRTNSKCSVAHCWLYSIASAHEARLTASPSRASWPGFVYDANPDAPVSDIKFHEIRQLMMCIPITRLHCALPTRTTTKRAKSLLSSKSQFVWKISLNLSSPLMAKKWTVLVARRVICDSWVAIAACKRPHAINLLLWRCLEA